MGLRMPRVNSTDQHSLNWSLRFNEQAEAACDFRLRMFYEKGAVTPDTPLKDVPFVALDFETTGLNAKKDDIVSIGLVPFTLQRIYCKDAKQWILNPQQHLAEESVVIHGITHADINNAPDLIRVLEPVLEALAGRVVVVHYRYIEREFFHTALKQRLGEGICFPVVDTMDLEARLHRNGFATFWQRLLGRKRVSIRLADSRVRYNLPFYKQHEALTDAIATAELLQAQIANRYSPDTPISELWR
ncbi:DNA polymerase-3 subunit epsilon [Neptunomonas antarctica]|uniref:DNA polymerase-3 subunit epsilon n=3 Tax=Neptunomonas antarctica TaxID=619304 RepID=A0A1N7K278_9GAMM|nr:DNA polymerase-3 subunit epsilon [Neptunomonas antarctica]SIS55835.1 DNA polymerase-3 subunit epsilon [Neptunomonas antarctica]